MAVASYNDLIARVGNNYVANWPFYGETAATTGIFGGCNMALQRIGHGRTLPSLPSGVTGYIATAAQGLILTSSSLRTVFVCECINLGTLDISTPTFTDGSAMPTQTVLGSSINTYSSVLVEVTTALNATPGSFTVTYVDQSGNAAETTTAQTLPTTNNGIGCAGWVNLNTGDVGVRDITTATRTGGTTPTGVIKFWGILPICQLCTAGGGTIYVEPMLTQDFMWAKLSAASDIRLFSFSGGSSIVGTAITGSISIVGDS